MNIITLSKKQFEKLTPLTLSKEVINTEGKIYKFTYKRQEKVLKKLFWQSGNIFANKLYTLEMLDTNHELLPHNFCIPDYLIAINHQIAGFTTPKIAGTNLATVLYDKRFTLQEQLFYLKKVGEILQEMKWIRTYTELTDFYINDLHEANFIADLEKKTLSVVDLDSSKIGSNLSFPARYLTSISLLNNIKGKYSIVNNINQPGYVIADENSDLYCYNIMILNYLRGENINNLSLEEFYNFLNHLDIIGINKELLDIFYKILSPSKNENPYLLLDSITEKHLYKVRNKL